MNAKRRYDRQPPSFQAIVMKYVVGNDIGVGVRRVKILGVPTIPYCRSHRHASSASASAAASDVCVCWHARETTCCVWRELREMAGKCRTEIQIS